MQRQGHLQLWFSLPLCGPKPEPATWELNRLNTALLQLSTHLSFPRSPLPGVFWFFWASANSISSTCKIIMPQIRSVGPRILQAARFVWNEERTRLLKDTRNLLPKHAWSTTGPETSLLEAAEFHHLALKRSLTRCPHPKYLQLGFQFLAPREDKTAL